MMNYTDPRRKYIEAAANLIEEYGEENVSARKLAALLGTAPSAIYRHFKTLDELMVYASIRYRYDTYAAIDRIADDSSNAYEMYVNTEREFARFAFSHPHILDSMVFGACSRQMDNIMKCYQEIFPEAVDETRLYSAVLLNGEDFEIGNLRLLRMCCADGSLKINPDIIEWVNCIIVHTFKGFLKTALDNPDMDEEHLISRYLHCFTHILSPYCTENTNN